MSKKNKKYIVITELPGNEFLDFFDTFAEAQSEAKSEWKSLSKFEKKEQHIYVARVYEDYLEDRAWIDKDGNISTTVQDWEWFKGLDIPSRGFDSENDFERRR